MNRLWGTLILKGGKVGSIISGFFRKEVDNEG